MKFLNQSMLVISVCSVIYNSPVIAQESALNGMTNSIDNNRIDDNQEIKGKKVLQQSGGADDSDDNNINNDEPRLIIVGNAIGELGLKDPSSTASRLGLSAMETPATIEMIDKAVMRARGYEKLSDAVESLPGVVTGEHPTAPSTFSMRGFSRGQITVLRDGLWIGPSTMVMRPQNIFNLERIEILRGPSSVINGVGAVAGTVNAITKTASAYQQENIDLMASYGRYNSYHVGVGIQQDLGENAWFNINISDYGSDGYVERTDQTSTNLTASALWKVSDDFSVKFSADYLEDDVGGYFGTPLVPTNLAREPLNHVVSTQQNETIDKAMRFKNYNVLDGVAESDQNFWRLDLQWHLNNDVTINNHLYQFNADRYWKNAEGYVYCTEVVGVCTDVGKIQRYYGYFLLDHEQDLLGNRTTLNWNQQFNQIENRLVAGIEVIDLSFDRLRGYRRQVPVVGSDSVDPYNPQPGLYGPEEVRGNSPTEIEMQAFFIEDVVKFNEQFSLVMAARYDEMDLDRKNYNAQGELENNGFTRQYTWESWRLGMVYQMNDELSFYGQYSDAKDPINSNIFLVNANQNFDLTKARQWEVGVKSIWFDGKAETTLAYYDIERDDIFERFSLDSVTNIGGRTSNGFELSLTMHANERWRLGANAAYTQAEFKASSNFVELAGNTPPNVAEWTANTWLSFHNIGDLPIEIGTSLHYVGDRYGDNPNTVKLKSYWLADLFAAWQFDKYRVSARIDNLLDEEFIQWSDVFYLHQTDPGFIYANQLMLGAPRTYRLMFEVSI
ncbi:TonB-dependent receptor [Aliikangiella maris]|uniref:TonB-dependent receptor n=2 Tax=Aliikangiella maris TaxID=3162458 RepID=A0ABV2BUP9_9GAMM